MANFVSYTGGVGQDFVYGICIVAIFLDMRGFQNMAVRPVVGTQKITSTRRIVYMLLLSGMVGMGKRVGRKVGNAHVVEQSLKRSAVTNDRFTDRLRCTSMDT